MHCRRILCVIPVMLFFLFPAHLFGQIVNIERQRISDDSTGWFGNANLNFTGAKSTKSILALATRTLLEYKSRSTNELWLLITELSLISSEKEKFSNSAFAHLRYNVKMGKALRWEVFSQIQYNSLTKIKQRALLGSGPRFKLTQYDNARFYWGVAYMFEYEQINDVTQQHRDHRLSSYFSFSLFPHENVTFSSTTYLQPLLKDFDDYRISNETTLALNITKKLIFNATVKYGFDSMPPFEVPKSIYSYTNGLEIQFN